MLENQNKIVYPFLDEFLKANELVGEKVFGGHFKVNSRELVAEPGSIFHFSQTEKFR